MDIKQDIIKRLGTDIADNDKPTIVKHWKNGRIATRRWYKNDQLYRDNDLPASEWFYENGNISYRFWFKDGVQIRSEHYDENGEIIK